MKFSHKPGEAYGSSESQELMAEITNRHPKNVSGPYFVDDTCTDCDLCRSVAPNLFTRDDETGYSYVYRQPITAAEIAEAEDA